MPWIATLIWRLPVRASRWRTWLPDRCRRPMPAVLPRPLPPVDTVELVSLPHQGEVIRGRRRGPRCGLSTDLVDGNGGVAAFVRIDLGSDHGPVAFHIQRKRRDRSVDTPQWGRCHARRVTMAGPVRPEQADGMTTMHRPDAAGHGPRTKTSVTPVSMLRAGAYRRHTENHIRAGNTTLT
jgi:hypothetical protein